MMNENKITEYMFAYENMYKMRQFELRTIDLFNEGKVQGTMHLAVGQEAIATAFGLHLEDKDYTFCTYRGHLHTLARGVPLAPIFAEMMGRKDGLLAGRGGSMHLTSLEHRVMGSYPIIGAHIPIANGVALNSQYLGLDEVTVCFFGEGTTNIGAFHEALNFAAVQQLPIVFVCENNVYSEYTLSTDVTAVKHPAADRALAYGLPRIIVDGNQFESMSSAAQKAIDKARKGDGPVLIEAMTYRHSGHSRSDTGWYRPEGELERWLKYDPLLLHKNTLLQLGVKNLALQSIEEKVDHEIREAIEEANGFTFPEVSDCLNNLWVSGDSQWHN